MPATLTKSGRPTPSNEMVEAARAYLSGDISVADYNHLLEEYSEATARSEYHPTRIISDAFIRTLAQWFRHPVHVRHKVLH